ncbi:MAG TPA: vWA domain-containing protein, partial [Kofleriaceae bacterium]|nr:vWA domain-containing protein [Kofleriaceae bacterium]
DAAFTAARTEASDWYFRRDDWEALLRCAEPLACAIALADSPHHHAYQRAVSLLISASHPSDPVLEALARFLEVDGDRPLHLRRAAAVRLAQTGDARGMPLLVEQMLDEQATEWGMFSADHDVALAAVVAATLIGGPSVSSEKRMWQVIEGARKVVARPVLQDVYARVLDEAMTNPARRAAAAMAVSEGLAHDRLGRVAEVFAWGVKRGVELTGRLFNFHLTSKETDYGYTRMSGDRIFISPLPMLRGEANGRDIVEGLVLHEIGHHVYHRGAVPEALWAKAHKEGIGHLLNLVADEHLERNLRAIDPSYGDRLKRLGAYAFQHAAQEIAVPVLLSSLRGAAAPALIRTPLEVGFAENSVRLRRGHVLTELDRHGHALARFARAFRLGLGNRTNDPKLAEALALAQGIRDMDMPQMYELTQKLAALFGGALEVAKVFGGPEGLEAGDHERDDDVFGAGVAEDALQKEIERILDPRRNKASAKGKKGVPERLWINVAPDEEFERIRTVEKVRGNPEAHRKLVHEVERHATRLRAFLDDLGLRWEPQRARTQGRALDRTRLLPLVTRNDPRILVARTPQRRTDLFLGVIVDCSGSMSSRDNIGRAKRFAALVAEAVRPLPGVEARFFGFTDSVIYDAGTARDCHVVGLHADGGNNDAAGLYHAANVAMASAKRAKVLVMISDGLPTECSVEALRGLVSTLTRRRGIVCAQVAVHPLEEVCFPNYVLLDGAIEPAVARFGRMIGDLAR